jgi:hypothetical protein
MIENTATPKKGRTLCGYARSSLVCFVDYRTPVSRRDGFLADQNQKVPSLTNFGPSTPVLLYFVSSLVCEIVVD